jgi:hypothetical protein
MTKLDRIQGCARIADSEERVISWNMRIVGGKGAADGEGVWKRVQRWVRAVVVRMLCEEKLMSMFQDRMRRVVERGSGTAVWWMAAGRGVHFEAEGV